MQKTTKEIIKSLAKKYSIPEKVMTAIVESPFKFTRDNLRDSDIEKEDSLKNFRYPYLGILYTHSARVKAIKNKLKSSKNGREDRRKNRRDTKD
jgi:hypothetical protein|tara:strand:+ start:24 stop:305 length:282 start_codon:yes stop_codon:yes gene_type:complete